MLGWEVELKRAALGTIIAPPIISLGSTPLLLLTMAKQTGLKPHLTFPVTSSMFFANTRLALARGTTSTVGKSLSASSEEGALSKGAIVGIAAGADSIISGFSNVTKTYVIHGKAVPELPNLSMRVARTVKAVNIGLSLRFPLSFSQAGLLLYGHPTFISWMDEHTALPDPAKNGAAVFLMSLIQTMVKNPVDVIQRMMLREAMPHLEGAGAAPSVSKAVTDSLQTHGTSFGKCGIGLSFAQSAVVFAGLLVARKIAETLVPDTTNEKC